MLLETKEKIADTVLVAGLVSSPGWSALLANFNTILTTVSLGVGLLLGIIRLRAEVKKWGLDRDD